MSVIVVLGNLGGEPELKYTQTGTPILEFSLADSVGYGDKKRTVWFRCAIFGKRAETLAPMLSKGNKVQVVGSFEPREWEDKEGAKHVSLDIKVNELNFAGGGKKQESGSSEPAKDKKESGDWVDDDIPF